MDQINIGRRLRRQRLFLGLTLEACSERADISARYLAGIEAGQKTPATKTLIRILNVLHASADDILQESLLCRQNHNQDGIPGAKY